MCLITAQEAAGSGYVDGVPSNEFRAVDMFADDTSDSPTTLSDDDDDDENCRACMLCGMYGCDCARAAWLMAEFNKAPVIPMQRPAPAPQQPAIGSAVHLICILMSLTCDAVPLVMSEASDLATGVLDVPVNVPSVLAPVNCDAQVHKHTCICTISMISAFHMCFCHFLSPQQELLAQLQRTIAIQAADIDALTARNKASLHLVLSAAINILQALTGHLERALAQIAAILHQ